MRLSPSRLSASSDADTVRDLIAERLGTFAAAWLPSMLVWAAALSYVAPHARLAALATLAVQTGALGLALFANRRTDARRFAIAIAFGLALVLGSTSTLLFVRAAGDGELLGFVLFTVCTMTALLYPWGWRLELALTAISLALLALGAPWLRFFLPPSSLAPVITISALLCIAIAEGNTRSFRATLARRRSEEAALRDLAISRDTYRDITENARDFIWATDLEGRVTYLNEAGARVLGGAPGEFLGKNVDHFFTDSPNDARLAEIRARLYAGESLPPFVLEVRTVDGKRWVEVVAYAVRDGAGEVVGVRGISRDVTERFEAAGALRESEARYRGLVESQTALIYRSDLEGNLTFLNEACRVKYGVVDAPNFLAFVHPDDVEGARAMLRNVQPGGRYQRASRGRTPEGWRWIEWDVCAIADDGGRVREIQGVGHDVTERRAADEALQESLRTLREREEQLRLMGLQQVTVREEERKRLGFDLHDGVCQELVGIGILIESARRRGVSDTADPTLVLAQGHLRTVGEHLRLLARELRPLQLSDLGLGECLRALAAGIATDAVNVTVAFPTTLPRLDEEVEVAVYRVAQEALANAVRHADAHQVALTLSAQNGALYLEVRDDGRGFTRDALHTSALGLVAMEERAASLGARLEITSTPGRGTVVRLACPVAP